MSLAAWSSPTRSPSLEVESIPSASVLSPHNPAGADCNKILVVLHRLLTAVQQERCEQTRIFHSIDFTQAIFKLEALLPTDSDQHPEVRRTLVEQIRKFWFETLQLDPAVVEL